MTSSLSSATIQPRIRISLDTNHLSQDERNISHRLAALKPEERIIFFDESRFIESMGHYSIEILGKESPYSTCSSAHLLKFMVLLASGKTDYLLVILATIYTDPYFKKLFTGENFKKYTSKKYLDVEDEDAKDWKSLNQKEKNAIALIKGVFAKIDEKLPQQEENMREAVFGTIMMALAEELQKESYEARILIPISEALAVIKIDQIEKNLGNQFDPEREISKKFVKELMYDGLDLFNELTIGRTTRYQIQKIEKVVKQILLEDKNAKDLTFLIRVGKSHGEELLQGLNKIFGDGSTKTINLLGVPLDDLAKTVKSGAIMPPSGRSD